MGNSWMGFRGVKKGNSKACKLRYDTERVTALDLIEMIMGDRERNPGRERGKRVTCENKPDDRESIKVRKQQSMQP